MIFVYFVVDKFYDVLQEPSLPLRGRPPRLPPNSETILMSQIAELTPLRKSAKNQETYWLPSFFL